MNARQICLNIIAKIQLHSFAYNALSKSTTLQKHALDILGIDTTRITSKPGRWLRWERPPDGYYKLNVDRSAMTTIYYRGGIIRTHTRELVSAFSSSYGQGSNNQAEFLALHEGLRLCRALQLEKVLIESDSLIVTSSMDRKHTDNWKLTYILRQCLVLIGEEYQVQHVLRQKNHVADRLVDYAHLQHGRIEFWTASSLPTSSRQAFTADLSGLWNFRP